MRDLDDVYVDDLYALREQVRRSRDASRLRPIGLAEIVRGRGAVHALGRVLERNGIRPASTIGVVTDSTPKSYGREDVLDVVLSVLRLEHDVHVVTVAHRPDELVHADEATVARCTNDVARLGPDALVSVGSGTVVDIAKYVARELELAHVVVQTAASVNGFADDQSVLLIDGVKRTTPSQWPRALVIDPLVVAEAPLAMTRSGLGDQLSMFSAAADWYLARAIGYDPSFSTTPVTMMRHESGPMWQYAEDLGRGDHQAVDLLASSLAVGGIAMGVAGRTAPSSGTEHVISHLLEMRAGSLNTASASHGSVVGVTSVAAVLLWERIRERLRAGNCRVDAANVASRERVIAAFAGLDGTGAAAAECWHAYETKATWIASHLEDINDVLARWAEHEPEVADLLMSPSFVAGTLVRAGAPTSFRELEPAPAPEVVSWALSNCHLMRDRFTVVDLADLIGAWCPEDVATLVAEHERLAPR
ncbi:MAG: iron-containing alcohol dehydrogenase [Acidimicrobiales bacterium]